MLFRIEDSENEDGIHREYCIISQDLPIMQMSEIEGYVANEIRKEVNGASDRRLLSYSKSLGICLLKYNKYTDNEIHINERYIGDYIHYFDLKEQKREIEPYSLDYAFPDIWINKTKQNVCLVNFALDVSNNDLLDCYLKKYTGVGRKKVASPEKDNEVLLFQSPSDFVIKQYSDSVYLLYALVMKFGMKKCIHDELVEYIFKLENFRFEFCNPNERIAIIKVIDYLFNFQKVERNMSAAVIMDSYKSCDISGYYDPITQFHDIQNQWFEDSFALSDYNDNVISRGIWCIYNKYRGC